LRKKLIAANWKMYKTPSEAVSFAESFLPLVKDHRRDEIVLCPPFPALTAVAGALRGSHVKLGAQDMHWEKEGAFTGEVSAHMLAAAGCTHVIIGHSERRQFFGETDETVHLKLLATLHASLTPIVCVGEFLAQRQAGETEAVLHQQISGAFHGVPHDLASHITIAYEPVWAIGTGNTATPEIACACHRCIRMDIAKIFGASAASRTRILYGGSVKPENAKALLSQEEIDGALVGGASLDPKSFSAIVHY